MRIGLDIVSGAFLHSGSGTGGGGEPTATKLAVNAPLVFLGDSITAIGTSSTSAANTLYSVTGFTTWGPIFGGGLSDMTFGGALGIVGDTTAQVLARVDAANALSPAGVVLECGTNDMAGSGTAADAIANINSIIAALDAPLIFLCTVMPRFGGNALTTDQEAQRVLLNTAIKALASDRVVIADLDAANPVSTDFTDGLHPNASGAAKVGRKLGAAIASRQTGATSDFDALMAGASFFTPNAGLTGSSGTVDASAAGAAADGYTLTGAGGGVTTTGSKDATTDAQVVTFAGAFTGASDGAASLQNFGAVAGLVAGDIVEAMLEGKVLSDFDPGFSQLAQLQVDIFDASFNVIGASTSTVDANLKAADGTFCMRGPQVQVPVGGAAPAWLQTMVTMTVTAGTAVPASGSLQINNIGTRKVVAPS